MPTLNHHVSSNKTEHTVRDFIANPTMIKQALEIATANGFIAESLFTQGYTAAGDAVAYHVSQNKFVNEDADNAEDFAVAEGQEPHQVYQSDTGPETARVKKYYIEGWVTYEEEELNQLGALKRLTTRMRNTMVKKLDGAAMNMLLTNSKIRNYTTGGAWATPTYTGIWDDLLNIQAMINTERLAGGDYRADTLACSENTFNNLLRNQGIREMFKEQDRAAQAPYYTGTMGSLGALTILTTDHMSDDFVFVLDKGEIGGIADARPLTLKPIEDDQRRERYFIRMVRRTVAFLTDPGAIVRVDITP